MTYDDSFGENDPKLMPGHFFYGSLRKDYSTAIQANTALQNCSICPRFWYVDAYFECVKCKFEYCFSAKEQKIWFEKYGFWVDAFPKHCLQCRKALRSLKTTRQKYDAIVSKTMRSTDISAKQELAVVIDQLYELGGELPPRIHENRRILALQLEKHENAL